MAAVTAQISGILDAQYRAVRSGAALFHCEGARLLSVKGKNAIPFINGLVTNDLKTLADSQGILAAFLNVQGKVSAICRFHREADGLLIELDTAAAAAAIFTNLSRFVPAGEFFIEDLNKSVFSVQGPMSKQVISAALGIDVVIEDRYAIINAGSAIIASHDRTGSGGYDVYVSHEDSDEVRARLENAGAIAAAPEILDIARLEAGIPREGVDVTEANILLEAGYEKAVSYTKGCYLGQEIIARIHWRGQPARQLRGLRVEANELPEKGTELWAEDGKKVGEVTSSVMSIGLGQIIALAYVHRYYLNSGTKFGLKLGELTVGTAELVDLPFVE